MIRLIEVYLPAAQIRQLMADDDAVLPTRSIWHWEAYRDIHGREYRRASHGARELWYRVERRATALSA